MPCICLIRSKRSILPQNGRSNTQFPQAANDRSPIDHRSHIYYHYRRVVTNRRRRAAEGMGVPFILVRVLILLGGLPRVIPFADPQRLTRRRTWRRVYAAGAVV